jgi:hypothetical protein
MNKQIFYTIIMGIIFSISFELQAQVYYSGCTATSSKQASAIGLNSSSTGNQSFASGNYATASGNYTTAFGSYVQATASNAFTFGSGVSTSGYLSNTTANSFLVGFNNSPVLFAQLLSSGSRVGIGTKTPAYTLDVKGDASANNVYTDNIYFTGTEMKIAKYTTGPMPAPDPKVTTNGITLKSNGRVGIGTTSPATTLDVAGDITANFLNLEANGKMKKLELTGEPYQDPIMPVLKPLHYLKIGELCDFSYDGMSYVISMNFSKGLPIQNGQPFSLINLHEDGTVRLSSHAPSNPGSDVNVRYNRIDISTPKFSVNADSYFWKNVGIKEQNPQYPLHVNGNGYITGNVGIGSAPSTTYKLGVNGKIGCKEIVVTNSGWADYVFEPDYELRSLGELESFILENKRLPEIPSATQVETEGVGLFEMNALLLKKVEELTLYILEQNKRIEALEKATEIR